MPDIQNFVDTIHKPHLDNAKQAYIAKDVTRSRPVQEVSPLTNLVFEFFLFNSLYSVDWEKSSSTRSLHHHPRDLSESKMQREFVKFCRNRCRELDASNILHQAFLPLCSLHDLEGKCTEITPDDRISADDGRRFFTKIAELACLVDKRKLRTSSKHFELIEYLCYFVYLVRNNIFHGSKSIGETYERKQARRIEVYDMFLRCLNSLFFLAWGKDQCGAGHAQLPVVSHLGGDSFLELSLRDVNQLLHARMLKPEDSTLHWRLFRSDSREHSNRITGNCRALFYPSAGNDILFPLLIGMPYCTDFFFYEISRGNRSPMRKTPKVKRPQPRTKAHQAIQQLGIGHDGISETVQEDQEVYEFEIESVARRVWVMHHDNTHFLEQDIPLAFYFHRGDSPGEGGSGQLWDSELLPELLAKKVPDAECRLLTDGEPGGIKADMGIDFERIVLPNSHRGRDYFWAVVR